MYTLQLALLKKCGYPTTATNYRSFPSLLNCPSIFLCSRAEFWIYFIIRKELDCLSVPARLPPPGWPETGETSPPPPRLPVRTACYTKGKIYLSRFSHRRKPYKVNISMFYKSIKRIWMMRLHAHTHTGTHIHTQAHIHIQTQTQIPVLKNKHNVQGCLL